MDSRPMTEDDISSCVDIFYTSFNALHRQHGLAEEDAADSGWLAGALRHFLETDPHGGRIAMQDGNPVAFASAFRRHRYWFLSFLFVLPDAQGYGIGRSLLDELVPQEDPADVVRATVVESFQPVSTGLYASYGMTPRSIRYGLSRVGRPDALPELPADLGKEELAPADLEDMAKLDGRILGFERSADHGWWDASGMKGYVYRHGDEPVGYAYVDDGFVGPALAIDEQTLCSMVADIVRDADDPAAVTVNTYGDAAAVFQMLLRAGARIDDDKHRFVYGSSSGPLPPSYINFSGFLP
ncbi:MAG: GNAT family N-acetyltransferase [Actinomycetota bacterium]